MDCKQCGSESHCGDCRVGLWGKLELREHDISAAISDRIARSWTLLDFTEIGLGGKNFEVLFLSSFDRGGNPDGQDLDQGGILEETVIKSSAFC